MTAVVMPLAWGQSNIPLPPAKQAIQQQYDRQQAAGAQNPAPRKLNVPLPEWTVPPFPANVISQNCEPPFSSRTIAVTNCWAGTLDGVNADAFAGIEADPDAFNRGIVIISTFPPYPAVGTQTTVPMENHIGSVFIIGAETGFLTLSSQNNQILKLYIGTPPQIMSMVGNAKPGDLNGDGVINLKDLDMMKGALNTPALGPNDPRDLNHDGKIDVLDARTQATLCTSSRCN